MYQAAIFLDKDGTLIENVPYNVDPAKIKLTLHAGEGLRLLHQAGYSLVVISNQSGVARNYFPETALLAVEQRLTELLAAYDVPLAGFYYCPHHPAAVNPQYAIDCQCRKPQPGLIYQAAQEQAILLQQSWFIGDILDDVQAGRAAGCRTILLDNGNETEWQLSIQRLPHHLASHLLEAAQIITAFRSASDRNSVNSPLHLDRNSSVLSRDAAPHLLDQLPLSGFQPL